MPADAMEIQVKDSWGDQIPTRSFSSKGADMTVASYGLNPGRQHHIWVLIVDDTAAREQRAASAALTDIPGMGLPLRTRCREPAL